MAKVLLGPHNLAEYVDRESKSIRVNKGIIIPPGMKDFLQTEGISIEYAKGGGQVVKSAPLPAVDTVNVPEKGSTSHQDVNVLMKRIIGILHDKHQVQDEEAIQRICLLIMQQLNK